jgi:hypothetical protein
MRPGITRFLAAGLLLAGVAGIAAPSAFSQTGDQKPAAPPRGGGGGPVAELRKAIAGKEKEPAEKVFKNIQMLKGVPAERLLSIMDEGFRPALGAKCSFCHDPQNWASDDKDEKKAAREMMRMVQDINGKYLASMKGLESDHPAVSCYSCHRGQEKPALSPEPAAAPAGH